MATPIDYEKMLNPAQLEAVMAEDGPILVIAGAGSGKTRTLVYRVARLVASGAAPESILLLTFTRKASQEMLDRAAGLSDARCRFVSGGTFHSLALKVLRRHAEIVGYDNGFTILDRSDMEEVIHSLIPALQMPKTAQRFPKRGTLANILSKAANLQTSAEACILEEYGQFVEVAPQIEHLGRLYAEYKKSHQLMDYDDLIICLQRLLGESSEIRAELSGQYRHIMVDEYQDTNGIQADIVKWLAHEHQNIMVVGDDSQSIYSFRGANYRNMLDFPSIFPKARIIKLEENYRSTQPILALTNALMEQAHERYTKCLFTNRSGGQKPVVVNTKTEYGQARLVAQVIREETARGRSLDEMAVLFRAAYHSFELEAELTRQHIPYVKYGGFKFLESAHIKDFLAHMRVVVNRDEAVSWIRILRLVKNVGLSRSQAIIEWMREQDAAPDQVAGWPGAGKREEEGLKALGRLLADLTAPKTTPRTAVERVMAYYLPILKEKFDDYPRRQKELEQIVPMAERYKKLRGFLDDLVLEPPSSTADVAPGERKKTLALSTVHSAKGLEWPVVFIIWVMEGRFPASMSYSNPLSLEEERRLMYVAATRAKDHLIISYPGEESPPAWASYQRAGNGLSSFIAALPTDLFSHESGRISMGKTGGSVKRARQDRPKTPKERLPFSQGEKVRHPAFGTGVISKFVADDKVEVFFKKAGRKLLHLEYTTLEKA